MAPKYRFPNSNWPSRSVNLSKATQFARTHFVLRLMLPMISDA